MKKKLFTQCFVIGIFLIVPTGWTDFLAQESEYKLAYQDIFGKLRRPHVNFNHEIHADMLENDGCGACHHVKDEQSGRLIYEEGEELSCNECHFKKKENHIPGLREAYHGSCTLCHRKLIKANSNKSGPTTCGGCHIKR